MHIMQLKKLEDSVSSQLQDAEDLESSVGSVHHFGETVPHGPTPYIVVREFPAWIDRGGSAFSSENTHQNQHHNLQSAQNLHHSNVLHMSNNVSSKQNKGPIHPFHQNGDLVHTISEQFGNDVGNEIVQAQNAKHLINQLGLISYKKPGKSAPLHDDKII